LYAFPWDSTNKKTKMVVISPDGTASETNEFSDYYNVKAATVHHDKLYFMARKSGSTEAIFHFSTASQTGAFSTSGFLIQDFFNSDLESNSTYALQSFQDKIYFQAQEAADARVASDSHPYDSTDVLRNNTTAADHYLHPGSIDKYLYWSGVLNNNLYLIDQYCILQWNEKKGIDRVYKADKDRYFSSGVVFRGRELFAFQEIDTTNGHITPINIPEDLTASLTLDTDDVIYTESRQVFGTTRIPTSLAVFEDRLYIAAVDLSGSDKVGEIWTYDPEGGSGLYERWQLACRIGSGEYVLYTGMAAFGEWLYLFSDLGNIYRIRPKVRFKQSWRQVADASETGLSRVYAMKTFNGELVIAGIPKSTSSTTGDANNCPIKVYRNGSFIEMDDASISGSNFNSAYPELSGKTVTSLEVYDGRLWVGFGKVQSFKGSAHHDSYLLYTEDLVTWTRVDHFNTWSVASRLPTPVFEHKMVAHQGKIYVLGGQTATSSLSFSRSIQVFDTITGDWDIYATSSQILDYVDSAFVHNGTIAFYSRESVTGDATYHYFYPSAPATILASDVYDAPSGYKNFHTHILGGKIFNMMGEDSSGATDTFNILDATEDNSWNWDSRSLAPVALTETTSTIRDGRVYVLGGTQRVSGTVSPEKLNIAFDFTEPQSGNIEQYSTNALPDKKVDGITVDQGYLLNDNFNASTTYIHPDKWVLKFPNSGAIAYQNNYGKLVTYDAAAGAAWENGLFSRGVFTRRAGLTFEGEFTVKSSTASVMFGWFRDTVSDTFSTTLYYEAEDAIQIKNDKTLVLFQNNNSFASTGATWSAGVTYRLKIVLKDVRGADYYVSSDHGKSWTKLSGSFAAVASQYSSVRPGVLLDNGEVEWDNFEVYYGEKSYPHVYFTSYEDPSNSLFILKSDAVEFPVASITNKDMNDLSYNPDDNLVYLAQSEGSDSPVRVFDAVFTQDKLKKGFLYSYKGRKAAVINPLLDDMYIFDQDKGIWSTKGDTTGTARYIFNGAAWEDEIYFYGGRISISLNTMADELDRYTISTGALVGSLSNRPTRKDSGAAMAAHAAKIYVYGGHKNNSTQKVDSFDYYDIASASGSWVALADGPIESYGGSLVTIGNYLCFIGMAETVNPGIKSVN
ncbi:hypothetical protein ACFL35_21030, partial [Candidatus Riflebacteria bacterium]